MRGAGAPLLHLLLHSTPNPIPCWRAPSASSRTNGPRLSRSPCSPQGPRAASRLITARPADLTQQCVTSASHSRASEPPCAIGVAGCAPPRAAATENDPAAAVAAAAARATARYAAQCSKAAAVARTTAADAGPSTDGAPCSSSFLRLSNDPFSPLAVPQDGAPCSSPPSFVCGCMQT